MKFIYNDNDINSMSYGSLHVNKIYYNGYVYQYAGIPDSGGQHPCFDVTDNISTYSDTEYDMVYDTTQEKWYMLNNLSEYEEYGIMGSGRNITTYEGKLTIDGEYEYRWDGTQWISVGEVTGGTASLPDIPFTCNYNARDYNPSTHTIPKTTGQLNGVDAVITGDTAHITDHHEDGYITFATTGNTTRAIVSGTSSDYWNRTNSTPDLTIICKAKTTGNSGNIIVNRSSNYNWMFRQYSNKLTLHGTSETGSIAITTGVVTTCSVRVSSDRSFVYNNFTESTTSSGMNFSYGNTTTGGGCLFMGYSTTNSEQWNGDFYWVYFSQNTLTDAQVQQVIDFNEGGGITIPLDYEELDAPVDNVVFSTMADALAYECPWIGMTATIAGEDYIFGNNDEWLEKYGLFEVTGEYLCNSGNKYKKMEEKVRNVDGTWSSQSPAVYEIGDLIEEGSEDCEGYTIIKSPEYLERSANANGYIPLGEYFQENTVIEIDFQMTQAKGNAVIGDYGSNDNDDWRVFVNYDSSQNNLVSYDFMTTRAQWNSGNWSQRFKFEIGNYYVKNLNTGTNIISSTKKTNFTRPNQMYLFHMEGSQGNNNIDYGHVYSLKIKQNGLLVKDFIPWTDMNGNYGLYDKVADEIHYSVGQMTGSSVVNDVIIDKRYPYADPIVFEDSTVKSLCVNNWGGGIVTGEITYGEAAAVTSLGNVFKNNTTITSFNELAFFGGLTAITNGEFVGCTNLVDIVIPSNVATLGFCQNTRNTFSGCSNLSGLTILSGDGTEPLLVSGNFSNGSYWMNNSHSTTPWVFPNRILTFEGCVFGYADYCTTGYFQSATPPVGLASADIANYRKLATIYCPIGASAAYTAALNGLSKTVIEYDFATDPNGVLDREKEWS